MRAHNKADSDSDSEKHLKHHIMKKFWFWSPPFPEKNTWLLTFSMCHLVLSRYFTAGGNKADESGDQYLFHYMLLFHVLLLSEILSNGPLNVLDYGRVRYKLYQVVAAGTICVSGLNF